jgi:hypothetical protein
MSNKNFVYMLDSGAYSVWRKGDKIDLNKYAKFAEKNKAMFRGGIFNLDFIDPPSTAAFGSQSAKKSYENWVQLRKLGVNTIPVHHIGDDETYLRKYMEETDYIGLGAIAKLDTNSRMYGLDYIWNDVLKNKDGTPKCRVHGLGLTDIRITLRYPWFSIDSTRAIALAAYGGILIPKISEAEGVSYGHIRQISVSNQARDHNRGSGDSFFGFPQRVQRQIKEYVNSLGYDLDVSLEGRKLNPKMGSRKKKDPIWTNGLEIPEVEADVNLAVTGGDADKNLSNSWVPRFIFNMYVSNEFIRHWRKQGKTIRVYNVVGGGTVFEAFAKGAQHDPAARCLVSYARMTDSFMNRLREVANGH